MIRLFDTLSKRYRLFPTKAGNKCLEARSHPKIFICGPTVYDYCHLGHARVFLFYDLVARFLRSAGASVVFVMNITDIDPKIFICGPTVYDYCHLGHARDIYFLL